MIKEIVKKIPIAIIPLLVCVALICILAMLIDFRINASSTGGAIGAEAGDVVGKAVGSLDGLTQGVKDGTQAGIEKGESAEDTTAKVVSEFNEVNKLEVLVASGAYTDVHKDGDKDDPDFALIFRQNYTCVFTINLSTATVTLNDGVLCVVLDPPEAEFMSIGTPDILDRYQKGSRGTDDGGYTVMINSKNKLQEEGAEALSNYDALMTAAKVSAEKQLESLVNAVSVANPKVSVEWRDR